MLIDVLKFLHLLCILGIVGSTLYCIRLVATKKFALANTNHQQKISLLNRIIMWLVVFAIITGTLLVHPTNFTFHTPWIIAAYLLIAVFSFGMGMLQMMRKRFKQQPRWVWLVIYGLLMIVLMLVVQGAVTKTAFYYS
jgi:hypothetical protein